MSKLSIVNLFLFLIVIVLSSVIYLSEETNTALERLTPSNLEEITSINIRHNKNNTIIVKQPDDQWQITQPINIAANNFRINSILKLINAPVHNQYSLNDIDTHATGLETPETLIQFNNISIAFGITNPVTNLRYVKLGDSVYTIEDVYHPLLSSHFGTLVSLNLLPPNNNIEKLILTNQTISKDDNGLWHSNNKISADTMVKTVQHWQQLQAFGVHEYVPRETLGEVFVYLENQQQPVSYVITDTDPWLIIARPEIGLEYHLDIEAYNLLINPVDSSIKVKDLIE